jgi:hypothetical protein
VRIKAPAINHAQTQIQTPQGPPPAHPFLASNNVKERERTDLLPADALDPACFARDRPARPFRLSRGPAGELLPGAGNLGD